MLFPDSEQHADHHRQAAVHLGLQEGEVDTLVGVHFQHAEDSSQT